MTTVAEVIRQTRFAACDDAVADSWLTAGCRHCGGEHVLSDMATNENAEGGFTVYLCPRTDKPCVRMADVGRYAGDISGWLAISDGRELVFALSVPDGLRMTRPGAESPTVLVEAEATTSDA